VSLVRESVSMVRRRVDSGKKCVDGVGEKSVSMD
jgi:hypothetical protein